jgi:predicted nucleotidyltransferase
MGIDGSLLSSPNNILGVEYCKAILSQHSQMIPFPICREGSYHADIPDPDNPSATAVRILMNRNDRWQEYLPTAAVTCFTDAKLHTTAAGERAILSRLRSMTDAEFEALPFGSEGLWRKLMHAARREATLEQILTAVKSKRYTRTRLDRMVMCAFLGLTKELLESPVPYVRALAANGRGREILRSARETGEFPNIGQPMDHPWQTLEDRCSDLYGLFAQDTPEPPGQESQQRIFIV